jgi:hypothetical protein
MSNTIKDAIQDALGEILESAGMSFSFASVTFKAWPVRTPEIERGAVLASQTPHFWWEANQDDAPAFKRSDTLIDCDGVRYTVGNRYTASPFKRTFIFSTLGGRQ